MGSDASMQPASQDGLSRFEPAVINMERFVEEEEGEEKEGRCDGDALLPTSFDRHMLFRPLGLFVWSYISNTRSAWILSVFLVSFVLLFCLSL